MVRRETSIGKPLSEKDAPPKFAIKHLNGDCLHATEMSA